MKVKWIIAALLIAATTAGCGTIKKICPIIPVPVLCDADKCSGDCNGDGRVDISDLTKISAIRAGTAPLSACARADTNGNGAIDDAEQAAAQAQAEAGC